LKEERCEGVVDRSEMGPGKPYWRMPVGETGETVAGVGAVPGTGDGGDVFVGLLVVGLGIVVERFGCCFCLEVEEKMAAVAAEPAKAEAAAMRARVVFDIVERGLGNFARDCYDSSRNRFDRRKGTRH
jgi:hypothetical protein